MGAIVAIALLLGTLSYGHCVELTQPGSMTAKPGQSLTISCKVSGYSLTDGSYCTHWIRQTAGKPMEWIGVICYDGSTANKDSLKSRFTMTRDTSSSTVSLQGSSLQTGDTAVYYCGRGSNWYGFDYWGKGTKVTVTSGESKPPSVFPLINCGAATDGYVIVGCFAKDFTPDDIAFKWTHKGTALTTESLQYPSIQTNGNFMAISHAKVKASDWDNEEIFQCSAESHGSSKIVVPVQKPTSPQPASLTLMIPSQEELTQNKNATFACLASEFSPKSYSFTWRRNGRILSKGITTHTAERTEGASRLYSATSFLRIAEDQWAIGANISCEFKHKGGDKTESVTNSLPECPGDKVQVSITPPSNEKLFLEQKVELSCVVTGDVENIDSVNWQTEDRKTLVSTEKTAGQSKIYTLSIKYDDWVNGTQYKCIVRHFEIADPIERIYKRDNGNGQKRPSVFLMTPDDKANGEKVTLICAAKGFYPKEILFSWNADDTRVDRPKFYSSQVVKTDQGYSAFSQLTVSAASWENGIMYSCVVHHEAAPNTAKTLVRTIDSISKRSTSISFDTCLNNHRV